MDNKKNSDLKSKSIEQCITYLIIIFVVLFYFLPYIIFGTNSIITIHDNMDNLLPYYKMYKDNGLFFKFDVPTRGLNEMSTLYFSNVNFSLTSMLFFIFNDFIAFTMNQYICILLSFFSMYLLLDRFRCIDKTIIILISTCFAILPSVIVMTMATASLPLIIVIFFTLLSKNKFSWKILFIVFFPFISSFSMVGIFILGFWLLVLIILSIKDRNINQNLLIGFILLCAGYIIVDLRLFYVMFILKTPLNRTVFSFYPEDIITQLKTFYKAFKGYVKYGYYHASSFQNKIIIPVVFLMSCSCLVILIGKMKTKTGKIIARIKASFTEADVTIKLLFLFNLLIIAIAYIAALYDSGLLNNFVNKYIPILKGFNWGRIWIFNRVLWYMVFAFSLQFILKLELITLGFNRFVQKINLPPLLTRLSMWFLILLQILYIITAQVYYNDPAKTWFDQVAVRTGIAKRIFPNRNFNKANYISYKEFFAENLFNIVKRDISYSNEKVAAYGYHPSVLMYNGFNCIDGYNNAYPLEYMQKFRTLIAPELVINQSAREYYDSWGGRMYLYGPDFDFFEPTRNKNTQPVALNIDVNVFVNFNGKYIISRVEISNIDELGLYLLNRYYDEDSIYTIYLYSVENINER